MHRFATALFCLALFVFSASAARAADLWPIEKTPWGMSRAKVIKVLGISEKEAAPKEPNKKKPAEQQNIELTNKSITANGKTYHIETIYFYFNGDGLSGIRFSFKLPEEYNEAQKMTVSLYGELAKVLTDLYGAPLEDNAENHDEAGEIFAYWYTWKRDATTWVCLQRLDSAENYLALLAMDYDKSKKHLYAQALADKEKTFDEGMRKRIAVITEKTKGPLQGEWKMTLSTTGKHLVLAEYKCGADLDQVHARQAQQEAMQIVAAMALQMVDLGINPGKEGITIRLRVYYSGKGLTGKQLGREYGEAVYYPEKDNVVWEGPEMKKMREAMRQ